MDHVNGYGSTRGPDVPDQSDGASPTEPTPELPTPELPTPELDTSLFAQLANRSRRSNLTRLDQLIELLDDWRSDAPLAGQEHQRAVDLIHQVVGSAGTFGFGEVSDLGRELEGRLLASTRPAVEDVAGLTRQAVAMRDALAR